MNLPTWQSTDKDFQLMQSKWASILNPLLSRPLSSNNVLKNIQLINGVNVINHLLGRNMQGWILSDVNASASIYRSQPMNDLTLTLTSDADCTVNLVVF